MDWITVYIGLGSNLQEPAAQVQRAYAAMGEIGDTLAQLLSPLYRSSPVGPPGQPDYINAAARLVTRLPPLPLLHALHAIEARQQRVREVHWGPRTIDLDILLYGNTTIATPQLNVPHLHLLQRNFVLAPLVDLDPQLCLADGRLLRECLNEIGTSGLTRINPTANEHRR